MSPVAHPPPVGAPRRPSAAGPGASRPGAPTGTPFTNRRRTLWEQGRRPGHLVVRATASVLVPVVVVDLLIDGRLGLLFDAAFLVVSVAGALLVRPRDFFTVGVLPPVALLVTVTVLAMLDRGAVARPGDPLAQAVVSGLARHAVALVLAYGSTLAVLALRQVALRHHGTLRISRTAPRP